MVVEVHHGGGGGGGTFDAGGGIFAGSCITDVIFKIYIIVELAELVLLDVVVDMDLDVLLDVHIMWCGCDVGGCGCGGCGGGCDVGGGGCGGPSHHGAPGMWM